jgi:predicted ATP-grasp superfamily ATP-dependent carboligase
LLREGAAMLEALAEDFLSIPGNEVIVLRDERLAAWRPAGCTIEGVGSAEDEIAAMERCAAQCDGAVLIAPELEGSLLDRCRRAAAAGARLWSPGAPLVALASDKHRTARHLAANGIRTPEGELVHPNSDLPAKFAYPFVLKPCDGAGSVGIRLVRNGDGLASISELSRTIRQESFCPGLPASVALLAGARGVTCLPACGQRLSDDGRFRYLGGWTPLPPTLAARAEHLARQTAAALPEACGYLGIDLVLGPEGPESDVVIEVNPRLTTSYLGLRQRTTDNLAAAMRDAAEGRPVELSFDDRSVEFAAETRQS